MARVETQKFVRKSFPVDAVQVTPENMKLIAQWCGGQVMNDGEKEGHLSRDYIKVRVAYPINERQTQAYLGDWVLKSGKSFKVYTNSAFEKSFIRQANVLSSEPASVPAPREPKAQHKQTPDQFPKKV